MAAMSSYQGWIRLLIVLPILPQCLISLAQAQVIPVRVALPGESRVTANRLTAVAKLVADKQWSEAIDEYLQIQEESGDDLVPLDNGHSISAKRLCQLRLTALPPEALRLYRDRVESQAKKWFEQGKAERDTRLLRRLVDEAFVSQYTDRALDLLGDLAFERGRFQEAESWWEILAPTIKPDTKPRLLDLVFSDPQIDLARVKAKQLLAQLFAGKLENWPENLKQYRKSHGNLEGFLAGQKGKYADILEAIFDRSELKRSIKKRQSQTQSWPTFAGDPSRSFIAPRAPKRLAYETPPWPIHLTDHRGNGGADRRVGNPSHASPQPRFFPVISGDLVFISQGHSLAAYDLLSARRVGFFDLQRVSPIVSDPHSVTDPVDYSVTISNGRVFAALAIAGLRPDKEKKSRVPDLEYVLVCLDLPPQPDGQFHLLWRHEASDSNAKDKKSAAFWEGCPIVSDNQVYIARTSHDRNRNSTTIDCFDADSGHLRWQKEICLAADANHRRPHLVTLAGSKVIYAPESGVIVALDATTGNRAWGRRYSSRGLQTENGVLSPRGLSPVVYDSGRVFAAPADFDGILCLDAHTGEKLWERKGIEVVHILGAAKGKLILTNAKTKSWPAGIRALDAETGNDIRRWIQPADATNLNSYGRGILAGDSVFWPVQRSDQDQPSAVLILNQEDGGQPNLDLSQFGQVRPGNMALGDGCLAVADDENVYVYVPPARLLEQRENQANHSDSAVAHYHLAIARADAGQSTEALEAFSLAAILAGTKHPLANPSLLERIRKDWNQYLLSLAKQEARDNHRDTAEALFRQAASPEFSTSDRLSAFAQQAEWFSSIDPHRAVAVCKSILEDHALRRGWLIDRDGTLHQAKWWAADQVLRWGGTDRDRNSSRPKSLIQGRDVHSQKLGQSGNDVDSAISELRWKLPLTANWQISLSPGEKLLGVSHSPERCLFTCRGQELVCREFMANQPRWLQKLGGTPTWLETVGDDVIVAGPKEINYLSLADGKVHWNLTAPPSLLAQSKDEGDLQQFQLIGSHLIFFQGRHHVFGVDIQTGRVIWQHQAPGAWLGLPPPSGRFGPFFAAGEKGIIIQASAGRLWIIDPQTGKPIFEGQSGSSAWPRPPLQVDKDRAAIILDSQHVILLNLPSGEILWKKTLPQPSMTALAPQLVWNGQSLCQIIDGWRFALMDLANGNDVFEKGISTEPINSDLCAWDSDYLYYVSRGVLQARSLTSAERIWERPLPRLSVPWRAVDLDKHLLLIPSQPPYTLRWSFFLTPQPMSFPVEMQWDDVILLVCDKQSGKVAQQWAIHGTQSPVSVQISNQALMVTVGEKLLVCQPSSVR
jgi:outer membrane protein assembly factor BamB/tetratricopeptide (TPR) repeat protein